MTDQSITRRNIGVLTAAQALGGASAPIVMSLGGLVGQQLAKGRCEQVPDMRSCLSSGAMEQGSS